MGSGSSCCQRDSKDGPVVLAAERSKIPTTVVTPPNPLITVPDVPENMNDFKPDVTVDEDKVRLRREVRSLSKDELVEVQWAFHLLQNTQTESGENRFFRLARLHTLHCQHWQYSFLPWHRRYLDEFEEELREVYFADVGDSDKSYKHLSLPYWSWASLEDGVEDQFDIPRVFLEDTFERNGQSYPNPLKQFAYAKRAVAPQGRAQDESDEVLPSYIRPDKDIRHKIENTLLPELVETMRNEVAYMNEQGVGRIKNQEWTRFNGKTFKYLEAGFAYHLEITAGHNTIHMLCGGDMGHPWYAALCPIFWFHHCNIERLWRIWQDKHVAMRHPPEFDDKELGALPGLRPRPGIGGDVSYASDELRGKEEYHFEHQPKEWQLFFGPEPKSAPLQTRHRLCWTDLQLYDAPYSFHTYLFLAGEEVPREYPGVPHDRYLTTVDVFQRPCMCGETQKQLKLTLPSFTDVSHRIRAILGEVNEVPDDANLVVYPLNMDRERPNVFVVKGGTCPFLLSRPFIASLPADRALRMAPTFRRNVVSPRDEQVLSRPGWNMANIRDKWSDGGEGVRVCVIDTGIDFELRNILNVPDERMKDFTFSDTADAVRMLDSDGHGTFSCSIVATIAPQCELYVAKALTTGSGSWKPVIAAIEWAIAESVHVICMALGSDHSHGPLSDAIHKAIANGIMCIAAAGNDDDGIDYPGKYGSVVCVGGHEADLRPAPISSTGPELDFLAPGKDIEGFHFGNTRISFTGSSVACVHVAGLAALVLGRENRGALEVSKRSRRRVKNCDDLKRVLKTMCVDNEFTTETGHGAIVPDS